MAFRALFPLTLRMMKFASVNPTFRATDVKLIPIFAPERNLLIRFSDTTLNLTYFLLADVTYWHSIHPLSPNKNTRSVASTP
jgi:hypothetical protein